jgi:hypothetical protein
VRYRLSAALVAGRLTVSAEAGKADLHFIEVVTAQLGTQLADVHHENAV